MATVSTTAAPGTNDYGGDEVSALVLDPGSHTTRAGFAGEDVPKSVIPTIYGKTEDNQYVFGDNSVNTPRAGMEMANPMASDGTVEDWDAATKLWEYAITSRLMNPKAKNPLQNGLNDPPKEDGDGDVQMDAEKAAEAEDDNLLTEHPLLMSEPSWNPNKNREKAIEIAMEQWGCPAFWLARNGVLAAFSAGKPSALIIDVGASTTSVTPVHDGHVLRKGIAHSPLASGYVSRQTRLLFNQAAPRIALNPHYLVTSKSAVDAMQPALATYRAYSPPSLAPSASFREFQEERVLNEFKESVVQVWPGPGRLSGSSAQGVSNDEVAKAQPPRTFEFPDGYNQPFGLDRYRVAEGLFDPKAALTGDGVTEPAANEVIPGLIKEALAGVDVDVRANLLGNTIVTGGGSLLPGLVDRISYEMQTLYPGPKVKITAQGNVYERRFGPWIGGSILASLGTFHQMWISKKEYDEQGASIVEKRCK